MAKPAIAMNKPAKSADKPASPATQPGRILNSTLAPTSQASTAIGLANVLIQNEAAIASLDVMIAAEVQKKLNSTHLYCWLINLYSKDQLAMMPRAGSHRDPDGDDETYEGNKNVPVDRYKDPTSNKPRRWWNDFSDATPQAKKLLADIAAIEKEKAEPNQHESPFKGMGPIARDMRFKHAKDKLTLIRNMFTKAAGVVYQVNLLRELPGIKFKMVMGGKDDAGNERLPEMLKPYQLRNSNTDDFVDQFENMSQGKFLNLDIKSVIAKEGLAKDDQFKALMATVGRQAGTGTADYSAKTLNANGVVNHILDIIHSINEDPTLPKALQDTVLGKSKSVNADNYDAISSMIALYLIAKPYADGYSTRLTLFAEAEAKRKDKEARENAGKASEAEIAGDEEEAETAEAETEEADADAE